jgi:hypothetical protein
MNPDELELQEQALSLLESAAREIKAGTYRIKELTEGVGYDCSSGKAIPTGEVYISLKLLAVS